MAAHMYTQVFHVHTSTPSLITDHMFIATHMQANQYTCKWVKLLLSNTVALKEGKIVEEWY